MRWLDAMAEYQVHNTNLWDIVRPALDLTGAYETLDKTEIKTYMVGDLRDGVGLLSWVEELCRHRDRTAREQSVESVGLSSGSATSQPSQAKPSQAKRSQAKRLF